MLPSQDDRSKRARNANTHIPYFDLNECVNNLPMLKRLDDDRKTTYAKLNASEQQLKKAESQLKKTENQLKAQELSTWKATIELRIANEKIDLEETEKLSKALLQSVLALVTLLLFGFGVNIATSTTYGWTGWIMIATASVLHIMAFFIGLSPRLRKRDR